MTSTVTHYRKGDPITNDLRAVAAGFREAYRNASSTDARVALHHAAARVADHVWRWASADEQNTLYRRWMHLCFQSGETPAEQPRPPMPPEVLQVVVDRLQRAGEVARRINEAARP